MSKISTILFGLLTALCLVLLLTPAALAQTQVTGAIEGTVREQGANAGIAAATVTVTNDETGLQRSTRTDGSGIFKFLNLPLGTYTITATAQGYEQVPDSSAKIPARILTTSTVKPPPIVLRRVGAVPTTPPQPGTPPATTPPATTPPTATPPQTPPPSAPSGGADDEQLVNLSTATRGASFDIRQVSLLPLSGIRSFDDLAFLAAGVAPPPQAIGGVVGPGVGAGIGTSGQFSVNGQRSRSNNFTVDGSDNNDEDVGVRRQGFLSLIPQSIESTQEFQIFTQLWGADVGRNLGSQVNAVSRSGGKQVHGAFYGFFNHDSLNARNFFDYTTDGARSSYPLLADLRADDRALGVSRIPVRIDNVPVTLQNPHDGKDFYQRAQGGLAIGVPISKKYFGPLGAVEPKTFFFGLVERQSIKARQETHFAVPTVKQRSFLGFTRGFSVGDDDFFPASLAGDAVFSLFPLPNNDPDRPAGPYGKNTFTQVLPADGEGTIFSLKLDHSIGLKHTLTGRYNFTNDQRQVPAVGGALFSGVEPHVRTQNLSLFFNSQFSATIANQIRGSYGRTRLRFNALRDPFLLNSRLVPNDPFNSPFLLNARRLGNATIGGTSVNYFRSTASINDTEFRLGTLGQVIVAPFSPVGLDVYLFPQARTNNTYQIADTLTVLRGKHAFKFGADIRRTQLNSRLDRNFRPQIVFGGTIDVTGELNRLFPNLGIPIPNLSRFGDTPGFFSGADLAAVGFPSGFFQSLAIGVPNTSIGLRFWQYNFFFNDTWRARRGLSFDYGLRYEYNTVPREVDKRIENTFSLPALPAVDPALSRFQNSIRAFQAVRDALGLVIAGRKTIYDPDGDNFGPHFSFAWDPLANSLTQAGKTVVRGGFGVYYDVALGSVVSQSRNVFPTFVPINTDSNVLFDTSSLFTQGQGEFGFRRIFTPSLFTFVFEDSNGNPILQFNELRPGTLNTIGAPPGALQPYLGFNLNTLSAEGIPSGNGLAFTLPDRNLRSPYALHFNLQIERELSRDYLLNVAYVGSRGIKLTRFRTPNGGLSSPTFLIDPIGLTRSDDDDENDLPFAVAAPPRSTINLTNIINLDFTNFTRPIPGLGAFTIFDSSAASNYHALQASLTRRFARGFQFTAAYTYSHAIDDVSDVFDLAGAFTLPQDDRNLRLERSHANFDVRHRFSVSTVADLFGRFNNALGAKRVILGGWQLASIAVVQTGQPFTVNTSFDLNLDGNLTDRLNTTSGLVENDDRRQRLTLGASPASLLAPPVVATNGQVTVRNGAVGRNTFRASGAFKVDLTLIKSFRIKEGQDFVFRVEAFNLLNRTHFAIPVRILEAPSFGSSVETSFNPRQVQLALKYVF